MSELYCKALKNAYTVYAGVTLRQLLDHLVNTYAAIDQFDLEKNQENMTAHYDPNTPIETSGNLWVWLPIIRKPTLWLKPPSVLPMRGVANHISKPKIMTDCTTALKKFPDFRELSLYRPRIIAICAQFFLVFLRFSNTALKSSSVTVRMRPKYLNAATLVSGRSYTHSATSVPTQASSVSNL